MDEGYFVIYKDSISGKTEEFACDSWTKALDILSELRHIKVLKVYYFDINEGLPEEF